MKKYQSYAQLKLTPTVKPSAIEYNKSPRLVGSPSFKKAIMYENNPIMLLSKQSIPTSTKYSASYLQRKKVFSSKKENKDGTNCMLTKDKENKTSIKEVHKQINKQKSNKNYEEVKNRKGYKQIQSKQKNKGKQQPFKNSNKILKISELDIKNGKERYDIQSPKANPDYLPFRSNASRNKQQKNKNKTSTTNKKTSFKKQKRPPTSAQSLQCYEELVLPQKTTKKKEQQQLSKFITKYQPHISTASPISPITVQRQKNSLLTHCTSNTNLIKAMVRQSEPNKTIKSSYYISTIYNSFFTSKPSSFQQMCRNHLVTSMQFLTYVRKNKSMIPNVPKNKIRMKPMHSLSPLSPINSRKQQTLVFDLDETLIHCNQSLDMPHDIEVQIKFPNGSTITAGINIRPYAYQCLKQLSKYFQIIVFTASHECYANVIIDYLDPNRDLISYRFFRQHCHKTQQGFYVKDLRVLERDLANVLLIDNAAYSYCFQPQNGIPIIPFYSGKTDYELREIVGYLKQMAGLPDIRKSNNQIMRLNQYYKFKEPKQLINALYL